MLGWELVSIIVDNSSGYTKAVEHVMLVELDHVWCLYFLQGNGFRLFREVISYGQDEAMFFGCWRANGSDNVHSPHLKWPWKGCWMKISLCLMDEVTVDLTGIASLSIDDGVRDYFRPLVAKSSKPVFELRSGLVSSTCTVMSFFECLMCLFEWKESE